MSRTNVSRRSHADDAVIATISHGDADGPDLFFCELSGKQINPGHAQIAKVTGTKENAQAAADDQVKALFQEVGI